MWRQGKHACCGSPRPRIDCTTSGLDASVKRPSASAATWMGSHGVTWGHTCRLIFRVSLITSQGTLKFGEGSLPCGTCSASAGGSGHAGNAVPRRSSQSASPGAASTLPLAAGLGSDLGTGRKLAVRMEPNAGLVRRREGRRAACATSVGVSVHMPTRGRPSPTLNSCTTCRMIIRRVDVGRRRAWVLGVESCGMWWPCGAETHRFGSRAPPTTGHAPTQLSATFGLPLV